MFSCKCSKIFKNIFFIEHPRWLLLHFVQRKRSKQPSVQGSTIHSTFNTANLIFRRSHPEMFLGKRVVRTPMLKCDFNKAALQIYWNHTSAWVFSCKSAAYFQNTYFLEHLWMAASVYFSLKKFGTKTPEISTEKPSCRQ